MPDVLEVCCVLPEVLLDFGVEGMVGGDHQGRMVAHLAKVLQCLMGRGEGEEDGRWGVVEVGCTVSVLVDAACMLAGCV